MVNLNGTDKLGKGIRRRKQTLEIESVLKINYCVGCLYVGIKNLDNVCQLYK